MAKIGYARVSTSKQDTKLQLEALKAAGCERIFKETASGAKADRPQLARALDFLREGDVLVVWKLDRLARSLKHLVEIVEDLRERNIGFKVLSGADIDTTTPSGRLVFGIFASLAEFERELIRERVNAGLAAARAEGRVGGRPRITDAQIIELRGRIAGGQSWRSVAKEMGISVATISRYLDPEDPKLKARRAAGATNGRRTNR